MSNIKKHFKSRFKDGYLVEVDYSQLEVIALAHLTQDPQLKRDILSGKDMHCVRAAELYKVDEATFVSEYLRGSTLRAKQRKIAKAFSFQLQYGSGATNMARTNGTTLKEAKTFIENYYNRYPLVKDWQDINIGTVRLSREWDGKTLTTLGYPAGKGVYVSETGRRYSFTEYDNTYKGIGHTDFSPTQIKNYPVQGFATGDIVPMILGKIFRALLNSNIKNDFLLVNTIHDSIIFDSRACVLDLGLELVRTIMENAPQYLKEIFDIDFDLPLKVDVEYGRNWNELHKYPVF